MNRPTDQQIFKVVLPGFRIQSEILTNLKNPGNGSGLRTHPFLGPGFWTLHVLKIFLGKRVYNLVALARGLSHNLGQKC